MRYALDRFLAGVFNPAQLQRWFTERLFEPYPDESSDEGYLWKGTITLLAFYGAGDFQRSELEEALRHLIRNVEMGVREPAPAMLLDQRAGDIIRSGKLPWPLDHVNLRERALRREGFQDI
jgi:hypothetical protein